MNNNIIDFTQLGGYRLEQPTFEKMQSTYFGILNALMGHLGVPDLGNFIISGCEVVGPDIVPGIMYIDGVLCPFAGGAGTLTTKIKKNITTTSLSFENGTNPTVFTATNAIIDAAGFELNLFSRINYNGIVPWATLINIPADLVYDAAYVHTDENFTLALWAKLMAIEDLAEKNVQSDFTESDSTKDSFIKNLPVGNLQTYLAKGEIIIGDIIGTTDVRTIPLGVDVGTSNYHVDGDLVGNFAGTDDGERWVKFTTKRKTNISFDIIIFDEGSHGAQNFKFTYNLNPL